MQERVRALFLHLSLLYADLQVSVSSAIKPVADPEGVQGVRSADPELKPPLRPPFLNIL